MPYIIVVSGLSASGKTTLTEALSGSGICHVPSASTMRRERYEFADVSSSKEDSLRKQEYYFELDKKANGIARELNKCGRTAVCDRDYLSALAHNYAIHKTNPEVSVYPWMVERYTKALKDGELVVPDFHVFLDVPLEERRERAIKETGRDRDSCFFDPEFCRHYLDFYRGALKCMPSMWISEAPKDFSPESLGLENLQNDKDKSKMSLIKYLERSLNEQQHMEFGKTNTESRGR